ncbi:MAG: polyisoprenoid-binding protein [Oceanospirillaceae bacterium]|nr:polyisoprenoid-binding protein [Oceanospirillaceae bacterium]MBT12213.1 polyisoprenoid-binding protein [Oceanospirillaceae bacterium]|tara:strand:- start:181860 stop:182441 length:582 start_codon:yes stop_codon:yes gene_type:complete
MKTFTNAKLGLTLVAALASGSVLAQDYSIDPTHTSVIATWNHFGFSNPTASFSDVSGTISYDDDAPAKSSVNVTIPVKTVDTKVEALTEEFLNEADYFDVAQYPTATFKSTKVTPKGDNKYDVAGDLTIKGVTKSVVFNAVLNKQGEHPMSKKPAIGFDASTVIKRTEFNMGKYAPYVSDEVTLTITTEAQAK